MYWQFKRLFMHRKYIQMIKLSIKVSKYARQQVSETLIKTDKLLLNARKK
jgi:hypothetical protein